MEELRIEIQRQKFELDKSAVIRQQKFEVMFLRTQKVKNSSISNNSV